MPVTKNLVQTIDTSEMDAIEVLTVLFDLTVTILTPPNEVAQYTGDQNVFMNLARTEVRNKIEDIRNHDEKMQATLLAGMGHIVNETLAKLGITAVPIGENVESVEIWQEVKS